MEIGKKRRSYKSKEYLTTMTKRQLERIWKSDNRRREGYARQYEKRIIRALYQSTKEIRLYVLESLKAGDYPDGPKMDSIEIQREPVESVLKSMIMQVGTSEIERYYSHFKPVSASKADSITLTTTEEELVDSRTIFQKIISDYADTQLGGNIVKITENSRKVITTIIAKGIEKGWGVDKMAREFRDFIQETYKNRAKVIARTETMIASNFASQRGVGIIIEKTGMQVEKIWIATPTGQPREHHLAMNGVSIPFESSFQLSTGVTMTAPHDPNAPASEVVSCRCTVAYKAVR